MSQHTRFVGLDVHKATIAVAVADDGPPDNLGVIPNNPSAIGKLMRRLGQSDVRLRVVYEAGPTGYAVHRQLTGMGIECLVVAPSLIPVRAGDRVKTDLELTRFRGHHHAWGASPKEVVHISPRLGGHHHHHALSPSTQCQPPDTVLVHPEHRGRVLGDGEIRDDDDSGDEDREGVRPNDQRCAESGRGLRVLRTDGQAPAVIGVKSA